MRSFKYTPQKKKKKKKKQTPLSLLHSSIESCHGHKVGLVLRSKCFLNFFETWDCPTKESLDGSSVTVYWKSAQRLLSSGKGNLGGNKWQMVLSFLFQLVLKTTLCTEVNWSILPCSEGFLSGCLLDKHLSIFQVMASNHMVWVTSLFLEMVWWHPFVVGCDIL